MDSTSPKQSEDIYSLFISYGFNPDVASTASTYVHSKKRSKKPKATKYIEALWSAHNKHKIVTTLDILKERVGVTSSIKLQPETGRIEIRTVLSLINHYDNNHKLAFLSSEVLKQCKHLATILDRYDGLSVIVTDVVVAVIRYVLDKNGNNNIRKDDLCKRFRRPVTSVTKASKLLESFLKDHADEL